MGICMRQRQIGPNWADEHLNTDYSVHFWEVSTRAPGL